MILNPYNAIKDGWITFPELPFNERQLQPNGIDLRIKSAVMISPDQTLVMSEGNKSKVAKVSVSIGRTGPDWYGHEWIQMKRNLTYEVETFEFVTVPENVCAMVVGRSTLNRNGIIARSAHYDTGFKNFVGLVIYPTIDFHVMVGTRIAQIIFMKADSANMYDGQYQSKG